MSVLLSACAGTKTEPVSQSQSEKVESVSQSQSEIAENACDPEKAICDCTTWPEENCILPHSLVMELLKNGIHPSTANDSGKTMLMKAQDVESIKALIAAGADVTARDKQGKTPLMYAPNIECARALTAAGADINAKTNGGASVLSILESNINKHYLVYAENSEIKLVVEFLKALGAEK